MRGPGVVREAGDMAFDPVAVLRGDGQRDKFGHLLFGELVEVAGVFAEDFYMRV